ncbi:hypothetical protein YT85_24295, partial [Salmonella enterica subsp. enterica serovar Oranienburg]|nr:hypothetical protein [Salmonella enterica subsp. enterica serovar Oranienburg]
YTLHISLLSESLTRKEKTMLSYLREGRSVEQTAALTKAGRSAVGVWYKKLCDRLTLQCDRNELTENFTLSTKTQSNPFRNSASFRRRVLQQPEGILNETE